MTTSLDSALEDALDHIDDARAVSATGPVPYIAALPASSLFADPSYQRELDGLRVQQMVSDWDPRLVGVLEVSNRGDSRYALIDGQHRWAAAIQAADDDDTALVCNVHSGLTPEQEARLFYEIDARRRNLTGWNRWWARRGSADPDVIAIEDVVARNGLQIAAATRDGTVRATRACEDIVGLGGLQLLDQALQVVLAGFGNTADALDGAVLHGTANVLHHYSREELEIERLITQMQTIPPRQVKARANALREAQKGTYPKLVACVLVEPRTELQLRELINDGLTECARVARRWLLVKANDYCNGRQFHLGHVRVLEHAATLGLRCHDLVIHAAGTGPGGGQIVVPQRARRAHSYLLVLTPMGRRPSSYALDAATRNPARHSTTTLTDMTPTAKEACT